jgi:hypothetical protein
MHSRKKTGDSKEFPLHQYIKTGKKIEIDNCNYTTLKKIKIIIICNIKGKLICCIKNAMFYFFKLGAP